MVVADKVASHRAVASRVATGAVARLGAGFWLSFRVVANRVVSRHVTAVLLTASAVGLILAPSSPWAQGAAKPDLQSPQTPAQDASLDKSAAADIPVVLVPHRAVYDLSLGETRGNSQIAGVSGRILYDFDGNACDGYSLEFRQVSELDTGEGKVSTSDLRSTTWETADAKSFKFTSQNYVDENLVDAVDGQAEHDPSKTAVDLEKPAPKKLDLDAGVVFPTEHMMRVINAARAGKSILDFPVYDGSETGDKVFDTLSVIGHPIGADERKHDDAAATEPKLAGVPRWPVTISYFDKGKIDDDTDQTPAYAIGFELYANGISRALTLDYNDFVVNGTLSSLEIKEAKPCP